MALADFTRPYRIHVGCNTMRIDGFVNVDARQTSATDIVHDCTDLTCFPNDSAELIFSHAFFEHIYANKRVPLLREVHRVLVSGGCVHFCGLPDFETIARCYLERRPGNVSPVFSLHEVYRYTHGAPEAQPGWWLEQLHKSLFDTETVHELLALSGFDRPVIYRYAYGAEPNDTNLGFIARKGGDVDDQDVSRLIGMFSPINKPSAIRVVRR